MNGRIWGELDLDSGNLTSGSGSKVGKSRGGRSDTLRGDIGVNTLEDLVAGSKEESGGKDSDSVNDIGSCGGFTVY